MRKFEAGKRYYESGVTFEIVKRTAKTVTYRAIQHAGRSNERIMKEATAKIQNWETGEVIVCGDRTIEALMKGGNNMEIMLYITLTTISQ